MGLNNIMKIFTPKDRIFILFLKKWQMVLLKWDAF